jgi:hypothetical protein
MSDAKRSGSGVETKIREHRAQTRRQHEREPHTIDRKRDRTPHRDGSPTGTFPARAV